MTDNDLTVGDGMVVSLDYTLRDSEGEVLDSSESGSPLQFMQGQGQIIPGLERELYGMTTGQEKDVVVEPAEGYGESDPEAYRLVPRDAFPADLPLEEGMGLHVRDDSGQVFEAYVDEMRDDGVVLNFNHPLAGQTLYFNVRVAGVREPTAEEREHGHVHGADGHEHEH